MRFLKAATIVVAITAAFHLSSRALQAYGDVPHQTLTRLAFEWLRSADNRVAQELGLDDDWWTLLSRDATIGVTDEDRPDRRVLFHFHQPTQPIETAGLREAGVSALSSVLWAQDPLNDWSWSVARAHFLEFLTGATRGERAAGISATFKALGHQVHHIQDASVPAHVRNDQHLEKFGYNSPDPYHNYVDALSPRTIAALALPARYPDGTLLRTQWPEEPDDVPIANLIDTRVYRALQPIDCDAPEPIFARLGIAEYASSNFLSGDKLECTSDNPLPRPNYAPVFQDQTNHRFYLGTPEVGHLAHVNDGSWADAAHLEKWNLVDPLVSEDYARKLLPRALGYSEALLQYFFRPSLDGASATNGDLTIRNVSDSEQMSGRVTLYYDDAGGSRTPIQTWDQLNIVAGGQLQKSFTAPTNAEKYWLVFEGTLGLEKAAVTGRIVTLQQTLKTTVDGQGSVTANGFSCGSGQTCTNTYILGRQIELTASGDNFIGWTGDCSGTSRQTTVTLTSDKNCGAQFHAAATTTVIDFDGVATGTSYATGAPVNDYLAQFGVSTPNSPVVVDTLSYATFIRSPTKNIMTGGDGRNPTTLILNFSTPASNVRFVRAGIYGDRSPSGTVAGPWTATAYDASNHAVASVSEPLLAFYGDRDSVTFLLAGSSISRVVFQGSDLGFAGINIPFITNISFGPEGAPSDGPPPPPPPFCPPPPPPPPGWPPGVPFPVPVCPPQ
jgi:hypothetical protein